MRRLVTFLFAIPLLGAVAAPATAQAPTTTEELLSGMVTEEVEPGVYRVLNDGVRDLSLANNTDIVAGGDGRIWLLRRNRFFPLGGDRAHEWPENQQDDFFPYRADVASDGTVWAIVSAEREGRTRPRWYLGSYDGTRWNDHSSAGFKVSPRQSVNVVPDGTVWAWEDEVTEIIYAFGSDGWRSFEPPAGLDKFRVHSVLADDGEPIVAGLDEDHKGFSAKRYHDGGWEDLHGYRPDDADADHGLDPRSGDDAFVGPDGTMWVVYQSRRTSPPTIRLKRLDAEGTQEWEWELGEDGPYPGVATVAADGSLWMSRYDSVCEGVVHVGGDTWNHHLSDRCVRQMDIAADGSVWVLAADRGGKKEPTDLYVITPEAVAGTE